MYCPEQHIFTVGKYPSKWSAELWFNASQDTRWRYIPLHKWINPLRYYVGIKTPWWNAWINLDGKYHLSVAYILWWLKVKLGLKKECEIGP